MENETPTFCKEFINDASCSFSTVCENLSNLKLKENKYLQGLKKVESIKLKKKSGFGKDDKEKKSKKRRDSCKFRTKKYNINNINEFIKKHKFKLRNDFDKKNAAKFLSSKEQAFNMPF